MIGLRCLKELILKNDCLVLVNICHKWYFQEKNFRFQANVCNGCHDLTQKPMGFNHFVIVSVKRNYLITESIFVI